MKKSLILLMALVMTLSVGYVTLASTIGIGATEGLTVELFKQIDPSDDPMTITGYYGLNEQLQLSLGYTTKDKEDDVDAYITLGARYAFVENMAVYAFYDDLEKDAGITIGFRAKTQISDPLALVGDLAYYKEGDYNELGLKAQAEYAFNDKIVANAGLAYGSPDEGDSYTNLIFGIEAYPTEQICAFLDYTVTDEDYSNDDVIELGISYSF